MHALERFLNGLLTTILSGIILGAFSVEVFMHEAPCPLCFLQRIAMIAVAVGAALNLRFGVHPSHYALSLFSALMGGAIALRQISLHVCPGFPQFGLPVLGLSLYTWSFFVFAASIFGIGVLLCLYNPKISQKPPLTLGFWAAFAVALLFFVSFANVITSFIRCGIGPCVD